MDCNEARELLSVAADGALDDAARQRLDTHVAECAACREEREELTQLRELFRAVEPVPAPPDLRDAVMARLGSTPAAPAAPAVDAAPASGGRVLRLWPRVMALAAVAAALLVAVTLLPRPGDGPSVETAMESAASRDAWEGKAGAPEFEVAEQEDDLVDGAARAVRDGGKGTTTRGARLRRESPQPAGEKTAEIPAESGPPHPNAKASGKGRVGADAGASTTPADPAADDAPGFTGTATPGRPEPASAPEPEAAEPALAQERVVGELAKLTETDRRVVVFADTEQAERFIALLRSVSGTSGESSGVGGTAPATGAPASGGGAGAPARDQAAERPSPDTGLAEARERSVRRAFETASAGVLADAAASGSARIHARVIVPTAETRVRELIAGTLEGRAWAEPLSDELLDRALAGGKRVDGPTARVPASPAGPTAGLPGAAKNESKSEARSKDAGDDDEADAAGAPPPVTAPATTATSVAKPSPARTIEIVILVIDPAPSARGAASQEER